MEKIVSLLTTTEGRIGRQQWWIGVIAMIVISIIASIILGILSFGNAALLSWLAVLLNIALIYPAYCIGIKRRHDRDNDGTDLKILIAGSIIINVLQATGIGVDWVDAGQGVVLPVPAIWLGLINLAYAIFAIYMFVQLGFLKGTTGANSYGLDPLDGAA
jgi:uncharacterized membrane protein YhaH (DUF805 family)